MASVVVAGGGLAGLACAWHLQRAGHDVEVLEREPEPGGRMRSDARGDFALDRGAQFVASGYRNLHELASTLGLADRIHPIACPRDAVLRSGRLHAADHASPLRLLTSSLLSPAARLRLLRLPLEVLSHWKRLDPLRPERAAELDVEDLAAGLRRVVGEEACEQLLVPLFSSTFDSEPEDLSFAFGLLVLRQLAAGFRLQAFAGGNGLLTRTLATRVPVRTGCDVFSVETETAGAKIRYRARGLERSVIADAAVVAVPGSLVAPLCPKLTPDERGFFEGVRYARGAIVHLLFERAPADLPFYGVSFPRSEGLELYGITVDHQKPGAAPEGAGLLSAALTGRAAARMTDASDAAIADLVLENLAATPLGPLTPMDFAVHRWSPMLPQFRPGSLFRLARFHRRIERSPRLAFAGDYLVGATLEAALVSGTRAAEEIARAF